MNTDIWIHALVILDDEYRYLNSCVSYFLPWVESEYLNTSNISSEDEYKTLWYFESNRGLDESGNGLDTTEMQYHGEFSFGTESFKIYSSERK